MTCKECGYTMHKCNAPDEKGRGGCMGQSLSPTGTRNHREGNWWWCLECDIWVAR